MPVSLEHAWWNDSLPLGKSPGSNRIGVTDQHLDLSSSNESLHHSGSNEAGSNHSDHDGLTSGVCTNASHLVWW